MIHEALPEFAAADKEQLSALFATPSTDKLNFCTVQALLLRNLPGASSNLYRYGSTPSGDNKGITTYTAKEDDSAHVSKKDVGVLTASLQTDGSEKDCEAAGTLAMPPPPSPPMKVAPKGGATVVQTSEDSGLSDGEIAGVAIGAGVGGIVVLGIVALVIRSLMFKGAKPVFTCLEKSPAEKTAAPAV